MTGHTNGTTAGVVISILFGLTAVFVALRMYARLCVVQSSGYDDWAMIVSFIFCLAMTICILLQAHFGLGRSSGTLSEAQRRDSLKTLWISIWTYHISAGFARASIILQCMRIFPQASFGLARKLMYAMLLVNILNMIWATLSIVFQCSPISAFWNDDIPSSKCLDREDLWFGNSCGAMALDVAVAVTPLPWIKTLRLPTKQKLLLIGVFVLGGLPCLLAIIRMQSMLLVAHSKDPTFDNGTLAVFSANEVYTGIMCACLPPLKALYNHIKPAIREWSIFGRTKEICKAWWSSQSSSQSSPRVRDRRYISQRHMPDILGVQQSEDAPIALVERQDLEAAVRAPGPVINVQHIRAQSARQNQMWEEEILMSKNSNPLPSCASQIGVLPDDWPETTHDSGRA